MRLGKRAMAGQVVHVLYRGVVIKKPVIEHRAILSIDSRLGRWETYTSDDHLSILLYLIYRPYPLVADMPDKCRRLCRPVRRSQEEEVSG
jgi:hypothetical protein